MGGTSGIGRALVEVLASRGVRVGVAARNTTELKKLKEKYPESIEYETIDINTERAPGMLKRLIGRLGGMDIYIHVSGIGYDNPEKLPEREAEIISTNAVGFARMVSAVYRWYSEHGGIGQIVGITSVAGTKGIGEYAAYSASKRCAQTYLTAIEQLSRKEGERIDITDIRPGWIRTPLLHEGKRYPMEMGLDYAISLILRAIVERKRVAYIDWRWGMLSRVWGLIPDGIWVRMWKMVDKF